MFEEIIKSISTIAFLVCTLFLGSIAPSEPSPANKPSDGISDYDAVRRRQV